MNINGHIYEALWTSLDMAMIASPQANLVEAIDKSTGAMYST
jgi:hypothetical protein